MKTRIFIALLCMLPFAALNQYSLGGGYTAFTSLNSQYNWNGLNFYVEIPRTDFNTFYLRSTLMLPIRSADSANVTAIDFNVVPQQLRVAVNSRSTYFSIDGGNRTYLSNTYDAGFAPYFGTHFKAILGGYRETFGDFDETKYTAPSVFGKQNSVFIAMGANIGIKHQLPYRGALTFDIGAEYIMTLYDAAQMMYAEFTPIGFFFNASYRFDKF
jgi:hypothetical protein